MSLVNILEPLQRRKDKVGIALQKLTEVLNSDQLLGEQISQFRSFDLNAISARISKLDTEILEIHSILQHSEDTYQLVKTRLKTLEAKSCSFVVFWKYMSDEQRHLRQNISKLKDDLAVISKQIVTAQNRHSELSAELSDLTAKLTWYNGFDVEAAVKQQAVLKTHIASLNHNYQSLKDELEHVESTLAPHIQEHSRLTNELNALQSDLDTANSLEAELSNAANARERAIIHQECENRFGTGRPKQIINECRGKIRSLENNIPKIERRIKDELQKLDRRITRLLIDGNNMCYQGQQFIGLRAINALARALENRFRLVVVFDASIRSLMRTNDQGIADILGQNITSHISPNKTAADEYLIKLAGDDASTFILSNDRYAEFFDFDVLRQNRILRFMIADNELMVNDLDVVTAI